MFEWGTAQYLPNVTEFYPAALVPHIVKEHNVTVLVGLSEVVIGSVSLWRQRGVISLTLPLLSITRERPHSSLVHLRVPRKRLAASFTTFSRATNFRNFC